MRRHLLAPASCVLFLWSCYQSRPSPSPRPLDILRDYAKAYEEIVDDLRNVKVVYLPFRVEDKPAYAVFTPAEALWLAPEGDMRESVEREIERQQRTRPTVDPRDPLSGRMIYPPTLFFKNGPAPTCRARDVLCSAAVEQRATEVDSTVLGLVFYPWFNADVSRAGYTLPARLMRILEVEHTRLLSALPLQDFALLERARLQFVDARPSLGDAPLWVRAVPGRTDLDTRIEISPILARAVFVRSVGRSDWFLRALLTAQERSDGVVMDVGSSRVFRDTKDIEAVLERFHSGFTQPLRFALAHEIGHVRIGRGVPSGSEPAADCLAVATLLRSGLKVDPGVLRLAIMQSFQEGSASMLWGAIAGEEEIADRLRRIETLAQLSAEAVEQECSAL